MCWLVDGYKKSNGGIDSINADLTSSNEKIQILFFEVVTNKKDHKLFVSDSLSGKPNLKLYFTYQDKLYMVETELPGFFSVRRLSALSREEHPTAEAMWMIPFLKPTLQSTSTDVDEVLANIPATYAVTSSTLWIASRTYVYDFYIYSDHCEQSSVPFGYVCIPNTNHYGATWKAEFYVSEGTTLNGVKQPTATNCISYRNTQISIVCGKNTELNNTLMSGVAKTSPTSANTGNILQTILSSSIKWWNTATNIVNVISQLTSTGNQVFLGSSAVTVLPSGSTATGVKSPTNCYFFANSYSSTSSNHISITSASHYIAVNTHAQFAGTSSTASASTTGCIQFKWDVYNSDTYSVTAANQTYTYTKAYTASYN